MGYVEFTRDVQCIYNVCELTARKHASPQGTSVRYSGQHDLHIMFCRQEVDTRREKSIKYLSV